MLYNTERLSILRSFLLGITDMWADCSSLVEHGPDTASHPGRQEDSKETRKLGLGEKEGFNASIPSLTVLVSSENVYMWLKVLRHSPV